MPHCRRHRPPVVRKIPPYSCSKDCHSPTPTFGTLIKVFVAKRKQRRDYIFIETLQLIRCDSVGVEFVVCIYGFKHRIPSGVRGIEYRFLRYSTRLNEALLKTFPAKLGLFAFFCYGYQARLHHHKKGENTNGV